MGNLETSRLILRTFVPEDLDSLAAIFADREVMRFSAKGVRTREETEEFINNVIRSQQTNTRSQK
jgi:RimJ/RimL family protein N-acetyltransferase